jgi:peptidyl-prolyl cis-trans isomerase A (cyclophilin A)
MNHTFSIFSVLCLMMLISCSSLKLPLVKFTTPYGIIVLEMDTVRAPVSARNFLNLAEMGVLNDAFFYRVVRSDNQSNNPVVIEVVQGGLFFDSLINRFPVIVHEPTSKTGILHRNGVISMARNEPGTASTEFFICVGDQPELNYGGRRNPDGMGFAAFGKVVRGMKTVQKIQRLPDNNQYLIESIKFDIVKVQH